MLQFPVDSVYNALAAMTTAIEMGISDEAILKGLVIPLRLKVELKQ